MDRSIRSPATVGEIDNPWWLISRTSLAHIDFERPQCGVEAIASLLLDSNRWMRFRNAILVLDDRAAPL
jgi:hypothetical protein